jgi:RNA polymerase sigma factor (TIGR02999 family)
VCRLPPSSAGHGPAGWRLTRDRERAYANRETRVMFPIVMDTRDHAQPEITALLQQLSAGSSEALHAIIPLVYRELRSIARHHLRREDPGHTLNTTALVHEAYLRLVDVRRVEWQDRTHFFAMASRMMRRILINYARQRKREKRGGGRVPLSLEERDLPIDQNLDDLLALDEALTRLEASNERRCRVVECRFFAGLEIDEIAQVLGVSPGTVKRDWRLARLWLNRQLAAGPSTSGL